MQSHVRVQADAMAGLEEIVAMIRSKQPAEGPPRGLAGVLKKPSARSGAAQSQNPNPHSAAQTG